MKLILRLFLTLSISLLVLHSAHAESGLVYSRNATINAENGELSVPDGRAWRIPVLPRVFNCPVDKSCPAIYVDGSFKVGDNGRVNNGHAEISAEQLNNKPLWVLPGSKVKIGMASTLVVVQEYAVSFDDAADVQVKPNMPIQVTYRASLLGEGYVGVFTNQSSRLLAVMVTAQNPSFGRQQNFRLDVPPNQSREIGHLEGWTFVSGDLITVTHAEYASITTKIP